MHARLPLPPVRRSDIIAGTVGASGSKRMLAGISRRIRKKLPGCRIPASLVLEKIVQARKEHNELPFLVVRESAI